MKNLTCRFGVSLTLLGALFLAMVALAPYAGAITPCCGVTVIDAKTGLVTAKETATGKTFQFKVDNVKLLKGLKIGQKVDADFASGEVALPGPALGKIVQPAVKDLPNPGR